MGFVYFSKKIGKLHFFCQSVFTFLKYRPQSSIPENKYHTRIRNKLKNNANTYCEHKWGIVCAREYKQENICAMCAFESQKEEWKNLQLLTVLLTPSSYS